MQNFGYDRALDRKFAAIGKIFGLNGREMTIYIVISLVILFPRNESGFGPSNNWKVNEKRVSMKNCAFSFQLCRKVESL